MTSAPYQHATVVDLLLTDNPCPGCAGALHFRALQTRGECRYQHDRLSSADHKRRAAESLTAAAATLQPPDQDLFLRTMLLVGWDRLRRKTGLTLPVADVLKALSLGAPRAAVVEAAGDVVINGHKAVSEFPLAGVLPDLRQPDTGLVFELGPREQRALHTTATRFEIDRVQATVQPFKGCEWHANLRALVSWRLDGVADPADAVNELQRRPPAPHRQGADDFRLLGLLDWMSRRPRHARANDVLQRGLAGHTAGCRSAAPALAKAMEREDVLLDLARNDQDSSVRRRAEKLMGA